MFSSIEAMSQAERNSEQQNEQGLARIKEEISEKERAMSAGYESFEPGNSEQQNEQGLARIKEEISEKERTMSAGYESFDELLADFLSSGHFQCTTVWSKDMVAHRCRTCQVNDSR
jgi:hypothetical protein